jgi:drug/metabolite transporter (DMT)-like permease
MTYDPSAERRARWSLHLCVLLWGFTAILGKLITLPTGALVVWRMGLVAALLALWPRVWRGIDAISRVQILRYAAIGVVIALHWLAFYGSIRLANASVAVGCVALGSVFAAILEPLITGRPHERAELLLGLLVIPGMALLVGGVPLSMYLGVAVGVLSALLAALFAALNKRYATDDPPEAVTLIQMTAGAVAIALGASVVFGVDQTLRLPDATDLGWLLVLAVVCTLLPFMLWLQALRHVSAFTTQLTLNLEPVYAIVLAALLFHEYRQLTPSFYVGVAVIIATVFLQPWLTARLQRPAGRSGTIRR